MHLVWAWTSTAMSVSQPVTIHAPVAARCVSWTCQDQWLAAELKMKPTRHGKQNQSRSAKALVSLFARREARIQAGYISPPL